MGALTALTSTSTGLALPVTLVVLFAAVLHATWNALTHGLVDKLVAVAILSTAFVVFGGLAVPWVAMPARASWPMLLASTVLHVFYNVLLMQTYRLGAFNQVYPLARGTSPWVVAVVAAVGIGEALNPLQVVGVVVVSLGLASLVLARGRPSADEFPAIVAAVGTGLLIATYTVVDGLGVRRSGTPMGYTAWLFLLQGLVLVVLAVHRRGPRLVRQARPHLRTGMAAGLLAVVAYGLVLWAQTKGSLAEVAALRETSVIVGAIIGALMFREPFGRWRTVATVVVVVGIALLDLG